MTLAPVSVPADDGLRAHILDALGEAVIATDPDGHIVYWNDAATRLYGWEASEVLGSNILEVTSSVAMRRHAAIVMDALRNGEAWSGEIELQNRDGETFPVLVTDTPVFDEQGELIGIVGVSRDLRGQREALRESAQRLDLIRNAAQSVIWELDPATRTIQWSDSFGDVFGYQRDRIEPTIDWWLAHVHPHDRPRLESGFQTFLEDDRRFWTEEYRFRRADESYAEVFHRGYASYTEDGNLTAAAGAMVDLSERRRMQDERRLLGQASMILDLSLDYEATLPTLAKLIVNVLADFCVIHLAPGAHLAGFTTAAHADPRRQEALDEVAGQLSPTPPDGSITSHVLRTAEPMLIHDVAEAMRDTPAGGPLRELALQLDPTSALILPIQARTEVMGSMTLGRSQHGRGYDEMDLRIAEELARRIGTAVDHARLYQSEQLANQAKSDFLAIMSHELRTPLTAVLGYADLLADEISGPLNDQQKQQVQRIHAGTDRLHRLLESILAYVRLETGDDRPRSSAVELREILERAGEVVGPRAEEDGVDFRIEVGKIPDRITTDPDRFLQVLLALLTNALKFAGAGTVVLRVAERDGSLDLDVVDSGHGIPEEHQAYIFNAFWQVEQPATRRAGGAGLGLTVARRLARLLGGDVVIAESSPEGTTFRFRLPLTPPE